MSARHGRLRFFWLGMLGLAVAGTLAARRVLEMRASRAPYVQAFARLDRNGDGRLSREEFIDAGGRAIEFDAYDANHDGYLDVDEFRTAFMHEDPNPIVQDLSPGVHARGPRTATGSPSSGHPP